jgi:predicted Ser/Thr protein kinase/DNA polymerase III delta prime subunit
MTLTLRLRPDFRLIHQPLAGTDTSVSREEEAVARMLSNRLANSSGGTFLITGFRGVGKTTAVQQALRELESGNGGGVIDVTVPVARPTNTTALLFEVIRRMVEQLQGKGTLARLSPEVHRPLLTAYARTSLAYRETTTKSEEAGGSVGATAAAAGRLAFRLKWFRYWRQAESRATDISFLAYSEADAEHDFLRIVELLRRKDAVRRGRLARFASKFGIGSATEGLEAPIIVVFDEIDKLTAVDGGQLAFENLLGGLKNLLGAGGVHFVVVAGVDLHDEWLRESATPDSLYRSVFAWQGYVGCSWNVAKELLGKLVLDDGSDPAIEETVKVLSSYLEYRGRGIIRNVLYELNELVDWDEQSAYIEIDGAAEKRVRLLADLSKAIDDALESTGNPLLAAPSDGDRVRQAAYFTVDWVLRSGGDPFTVNDVLDTAQPTPLAPVLRPPPELITHVLQSLAEEGYLTVDHRDKEIATQGPDSEAEEERFRLSPSLLEKLSAIARSSPRGRAELGRGIKEGIESSGGGEIRKTVQELLNSRDNGTEYELVELLGRGSYATVWRGLDSKSGKQVAIKDIRTRTDATRKRAEEEARLLKQLHEGEIPGMVRLVETVQSHERMIIVTELVAGNNLRDIRELDPLIAVDVALQVVRTLIHLHQRRIVHADLKPSNIILARGGRPVILDLGSAATEEQESQGLTGMGTLTEIVGTPAYMAPEVVMGTPPTAKADVWGVGILMLQMIGGRIPSDRSPAGIERAITELDVSETLRDVVRGALAYDPSSRPSAVELLSQLSKVPEASFDGRTESNGHSSPND